MKEILLRSSEQAELHCPKSHGHHLLLEVFLRDFDHDHPATDHDVTFHVLPNLRVALQDGSRDSRWRAKQLFSNDFRGLEESLK